MYFQKQLPTARRPPLFKNNNKQTRQPPTTKTRLQTSVAVNNMSPLEVVSSQGCGIVKDDRSLAL